MRLISFDPGWATGWSVWYWDNKTPLTRKDYGVTPQGAEGLSELLWNVESWQAPFFWDAVISERFVPDGSAGGRETVSAQGEGVLIHAFDNVTFQLRSEKVWFGRTVADSDARLKELGLWIDNSEVDWTDARDVNDSQHHAIKWAIKNRHRPSIEYFLKR